jgi:hypothetical protein
MKKDNAPTYVVVTLQPAGPVHLSADDAYTLCGRPIRMYWQRQHERGTLRAVQLAGRNAGAPLCQQCEWLAAVERAEEAAP